MGFFDALGKAAKGTADYVKETKEKSDSLKEEYENKSNEYLLEKSRHGDVWQKMAATLVLKKRGYALK